MKHVLALTGALLVTGACCLAGREPLQVVDKVDLERYAGRWYEVARYPNRFQKNCYRAAAEYLIRDDGNVTVVNTCSKNRDGSGETKRIRGKAWVVDKTTGAKLKVRFFWPFSGNYWIIELGDDYQYAVIGEPKRKYLWILSRTPQLPEETMKAIKSRLPGFGYDPARLISE